MLALDNQQKEGEVFLNIFAHIVGWNTIIIILRLTAYKRWSLCQFDAIMAFLNRSVTKDIYMHTPP
uniref:Reverse transcriptase Ty1/copia-type domain-containing protein n=1 Tax=Physcomitrium patens TaxID=3218 RepID=A0A2K1KHI7_PHYPA|nr:hypothetical protein PHYPA_009614 [Physcomitrium patens]